MFNKLYPQVWMSLPTEAKQVLIKYFGIKKTGAVEVFNDQVKSDGYTEGDLNAVNVESMSSFIGAEEKLSFASAWELTLKKVEFILNPPPADYVIPPPIETPKKNDEPLTGAAIVEAPSTTAEVAGSSLETQLTEALNTSTIPTGETETNSSKTAEEPVLQPALVVEPGHAIEQPTITKNNSTPKNAKKNKQG